MTGDPSREPDAPEAPAWPSSLKEGRFRVIGLLGRGAHAETLDAIDESTHTPVAIKRFQVRGKKSWKEIELAEREARVLSGLDHPNLPKYVAHFEEAGELYLVMEKITGPTLAELRQRGSLSQAEVTRFMVDTGETLNYLHGQAPPIIHRDIKPENVIRRADGSFALVDFGSVRDRLRPEGGSTVVGTFGYMAPEQFQGRALPATDLYGVGATALVCLSGREPESLPHRGLALDVKAAIGTQVDPLLVTLIERLVEPDPDRRPRSLRAAVQQALQSTEAAPAPASPELVQRPRPARVEQRSSPLRTLLILVFTVVVAVGGALLLARGLNSVVAAAQFVQRHWLALLIAGLVLSRVMRRGKRSRDAHINEAEREQRQRQDSRRTRVESSEAPRVRVRYDDEDEHAYEDEAKDDTDVTSRAGRRHR